MGDDTARPTGGEETTLDQLTADTHNRRTRTPRNVAMIVAALQQVGASRSIVIDEHNAILAGNGVAEAAAQATIGDGYELDDDPDRALSEVCKP